MNRKFYLNANSSKKYNYLKEFKLFISLICLVDLAYCYCKAIPGWGGGGAIPHKKMRVP